MKQKQWFLPELLLDQENRSKTTENKYVAIVANSHSFYNIPQKGLHILVIEVLFVLGTYCRKQYLVRSMFVKYNKL